ncbi:MAG TPA: hypothetical protein VEL03_15005 [Streptosporangiaceae bacterium]|nr:hypothetical protein [Streptosporangiaceae bacterium]
MRMRTTIARTGLGARLTVAGWVTATILAAVLIGACSGSAPKATLPRLSPAATASVSASSTATPSSSASASPTATPSTSASASPSATPSASPSASPTPAPSATSIPAVAPATGGGGTAGFQHAWLVEIGVVAILAGAGCIAYRRKVIRNR